MPDKKASSQPVKAVSDPVKESHEAYVGGLNPISPEEADKGLEGMIKIAKEKKSFGDIKQQIAIRNLISSFIKYNINKVDVLKFGVGHAGASSLRDNNYKIWSSIYSKSSVGNVELRITVDNKGCNYSFNFGEHKGLKSFRELEPVVIEYLKLQNSIRP